MISLPMTLERRLVGVGWLRWPIWNKSVFELGVINNVLVCACLQGSNRCGCGYVCMQSIEAGCIAPTILEVHPLSTTNAEADTGLGEKMF